MSSTIQDFPPNKEVLLQEAMDLLFESSKKGLEEEDYWEDSMEMDELISRVQFVLQGGLSVDDAFVKGKSSSGDSTASNDGMDFSMGTGTSISSVATATMSNSMLKKLDEYYKICNEKRQGADQDAEFKVVEGFVLKEQTSSRDRRYRASRVEASEEKRLAVEVAQLRGLRLKSQKNRGEDDLRWKISDAERSYINRKMVYAKASQVAGADLRSQFARVRVFLEKMHSSRQQTLYREHRRALNFQALMHALKKSDTRVISLDRQIALRLYRKKKADLAESHMKQTLLEAEYIESVMNMLDTVQNSKEAAARELFNLHVTNLKIERGNNERRQDEFELFVASGTLEMAKLVALYAAEDFGDQDHDEKVQERVATMERKNDRENSKGGAVSLSRLYDTVLYSVTSNDLGFTSSGSSLYSSDYGSVIECDDDDADQNKNSQFPSDSMETNEEDEDGDGGNHHPKCQTPVGRMHSRRLAKELRAREKALIKKHDEEIRLERREYQKSVRALKAKHQNTIDKVLETSLAERENLRDTIDERMEQLTKSQEDATEQMQKKDRELMRQTLFEEDTRLREAETSSFVKAQELISAQVFHEVRNALSSVIAMSEMTTTLKNDKSLTPKELVGSVDDMLDQIGDVVDYALKMLNDILDVSKINSGAFVPKKEAFDLQDIVARATRMQQAKATRIKLSFQPSPQPCIAVSDSGIVERIVATLISNAVKFTQTGAVQTFIWPYEVLQEGSLRDSDATGSTGSETLSDDSNASSSETIDTDILSTSSSTSSRKRKRTSSALQVLNNRMKYVAVGVADTGHGLSEEVLEAAKYAISTSTSSARSHGAQNTGFGLYHAHLQTRALSSQLRLSSLEECHGLLNEDMLNAKSKYQSSCKKIHSSTTSLKECTIPGKGTVLYFTIPVYEDSDSAEKVLQLNQDTTILACQARSKSEYVFRPLPAPEGCNGCFRILVADDVMMLRKGMVHTIMKLWTKNFPDCPVSVRTACTAEDVMRTVQSEVYDLIICDHHFNHDNSKLKKITPGYSAAADHRPTLRCDGRKTTPEEARKDIRAFFEKECFTLEEDDGSLLGLNALLQIAESSLGNSSTPVLMLVSGHKIEVEPGLGIMVVQKPLKLSDFISTLESHALRLLEAGRLRLRQDSMDTSENQAPDTIVNSSGSRLFVRCDTHAA